MHADGTLPPRSFIWLASSSPRRQELLRQIGVEFRLLAPDDGEDTESLEQSRPGEDAAKYVLRVAIAKAQAGRERLLKRNLQQAPILAADTTVALGGTLLAKPVDAADAARMLGMLSGRTHRVLTAIAIARGARTIDSAISVSRVTFERMSQGAIDRYIATGEPMDKAGGYGIQGAVARHVRRIQGSYSGIMGLPLYETARLLGAAGRSGS